MITGSSEQPSEELEERRFRVYGRVQGVGFRWWARTEAQRLNISGEVRNLADGTVEVRAGGRRSDIDAFGRLLERGAPGAVVSHVDVESDSGVRRKGFEIER